MNPPLHSPAAIARDLQIEVIQSVDRWETFAETWNAMASSRPLQRYEWLRGWWTGYRAGRELRVLRIHDASDATYGFLPLCKSRTATGARQLALLGSGKACSDDLTLLVRDSEWIEPAVACCAAWLASAAEHDPWDVVDLEGVSPEDTAVCALLRHLDAVGFSTVTQPDQSCWRASLDCSFETYLTTLTKRARRLLRTHTERFERGETTFQIAETEVQRDAYFHAITQFHQLRWAAEGVHGCFSTTEFHSFLKDAIDRLWESGHGVLTQVSYQGEPMSGSIGIVLNGVHSVYLVGNHPQFAELQPGWSLNAALLRSACDRGFRAIDFLRGDEPYKARLGAQPRPQVRCFAYGQNARAKAEQGLLAVKTALHKFVDGVRS